MTIYVFFEDRVLLERDNAVHWDDVPCGAYMWFSGGLVSNNSHWMKMKADMDPKNSFGKKPVPLSETVIPPQYRTLLLLLR